nr:NADPH-dependent 7-cyano-7-deazaguanine reductase QueF [secondary endosymbiont of Heteropsylla cubana]
MKKNIFKKLPLGKKTSYIQKYSPALLKGIPRNLNYNKLDLSRDKQFFHGKDIWTLYELSWLNKNGIPQIAIGDVQFNCKNKNIAESKSVKLYLNSFNQSIFNDWNEVKYIIKNDLSKISKGNVDVALYKIEELEKKAIGTLLGFCIDDQDIIIRNFEFNNKYLLHSTRDVLVEETLVSHILKSNCLITNQPDWGSVQIKYSGKKIDHAALLRYLVSFRQHNEFHEQCVERIFHDIMQYCNPKKLSVYARYTRRGGIDINPWRSNTHFIPTKERLSRQ